MCSAIWCRAVFCVLLLNACAGCSSRVDPLLTTEKLTADSKGAFLVATRYVASHSVINCQAVHFVKIDGNTESLPIRASVVAPFGIGHSIGIMTVDAGRYGIVSINCGVPTYPDYFIKPPDGKYIAAFDIVPGDVRNLGTLMIVEVLLDPPSGAEVTLANKDRKVVLFDLHRLVIPDGFAAEQPLAAKAISKPLTTIDQLPPRGAKAICELHRRRRAAMWVKLSGDAPICAWTEADRLSPSQDVGRQDQQSLCAALKAAGDRQTAAALPAICAHENPMFIVPAEQVAPR